MRNFLRIQKAVPPFLLQKRTNFFWKNKSPKLNTVTLGNVSSVLSVPEHIQCPDYAHNCNRKPVRLTRPEILKTDLDLQHMRKSCQLAASILKKCRTMIKTGVTTDEIDRFVHNEIITANAYPSPLKFNGFPKSVCTSVNNVACHGIPDDRALCDGDILNIDVTVYLNGFHGDCSEMYLVGNVDERSRFLVDITRKCLYRAIAKCAPNVMFNEIGNEIDRTARQNGLLVVPCFTGHGIGRYFHGPPEILHYNNAEGGLMQSGMVFTIEPILTLGKDIEIEIQDDEWTAMTVDESRTAQVEHTILITDDGHEILTQSSS